ncbi:MAG: histone deacetylase [Polyangiaceae bacterium]|nr:histone deacetylase [Polyangiaceae bacterium]
MSLPVFFCNDMVARPQSFSPSAAKPRAVVDDWLRRGLAIDIRVPTPATMDDLTRAHDPDYVRGVLDGRIPNGFGDRSMAVASSLPFTSGAMLSAARHALQTGSITCAPCSGFHHAGWDQAAGYCTFNGLVVAACALLADGARSVGILDCDMHYGDGTDAILAKLGLGGADGRIVHFTAGATYSRRPQARSFLDRLPDVVGSMQRCDVVLYQAGADPHVRDPLGGFLDDDDLRTRDQIVFRTARALGVPVAWNLAGGYQRDKNGGIGAVLSIHAATAEAAIDAARAPIPTAGDAAIFRAP